MNELLLLVCITIVCNASIRRERCLLNDRSKFHVSGFHSKKEKNEREGERERERTSERASEREGEKLIVI